MGQFQFIYHILIIYVTNLLLLLGCIFMLLLKVNYLVKRYLRIMLIRMNIAVITVNFGLLMILLVLILWNQEYVIGIVMMGIGMMLMIVMRFMLPPLSMVMDPLIMVTNMLSILEIW